MVLIVAHLVMNIGQLFARPSHGLGRGPCSKSAVMTHSWECLKSSFSLYFLQTNPNWHCKAAQKVVAFLLLAFLTDYFLQTWFVSVSPCSILSSLFLLLVGHKPGRGKSFSPAGTNHTYWWEKFLWFTPRGVLLILKNSC